MKKFLYTLLFVFTAAIWSRNVCFAEELKFGNFTYELLPDSTAEITGYTGEDKEIVIPDKAEDAPVTSIGANAFTSNKTVEQITIPVSVVSISDHAFSECTALKAVTLPAGLLSMGDLVFQGDVALESVTLPASLVHIGMNPFDRCDELKEISISGDNIFYHVIDGVLYNRAQTVLISYPTGKPEKNFVVPETVTELAFASFSENKYIEDITLPDTITKINGNPFCGCVHLAAMHISPFSRNFEFFSGALFNTQDRELIAYLWGSENESYTVPKGIRSIAQEAFYKHPELKKIELPQTLTTIKDAAFAECGLTEIKIPDNVIAMGNSTFSNCADLKSVTFPSGLTWIGNYAFYECEALTTLTLPKSLADIGEAAFYHCTGLTELVLPENLMFIGDYAFLECTGVKKIDFSSNLFSIGRAAFYGIQDLVVSTEHGTLGEEWALQNQVRIEYKNVDYMPTDLI